LIYIHIDEKFIHSEAFIKESRKTTSMRKILKVLFIKNYIIKNLKNQRCFNLIKPKILQIL